MRQSKGGRRPAVSGKDAEPRRQNGSAGERVARAIVEEISRGTLLPGSRLDEIGLAKRFAVSRTPVREALKRLAAKGIVEEAHGRGAIVPEHGREELAQMYEAMHEIEALCARLAAQRINLLQRAELEAAHRRCAQAADAGDFAAFLDTNDAFHRAIYQATQNRFIEEMAISFRERTRPFRARKFRDKADLLNSVAEHAEIVRAVTGAEHQAAYDDMRSHLTASYIRMVTEAA